MLRLAEERELLLLAMERELLRLADRGGWRAVGAATKGLLQRALEKAAGLGLTFLGCVRFWVCSFLQEGEGGRSLASRARRAALSMVASGGFIAGRTILVSRFVGGRRWRQIRRPRAKVPR